MKSTKVRTLCCALVALVLSVLATDLYAQVPRFQSTIGDGNNQNGYAVEQLPDSGYVIAGYTFRTGGNCDAYLMRVNRVGTLVWAFSFDIGGNDTAYSVTLASDGGFVITGKTQNTNGCTQDDIFLLKTNNAGTHLWTRIFGGSGDEAGNGVQRTSDNGYIITGRTNSFGAGQYDGFLLKTDINGNLSWWNTYGSTGDDLFRSVHQTTDGGYVACGTTTSYGNGAQGYVVRTNGTGALQWAREFGGGQLEYMWSIRQTNDGGYITVGTEVSFTSSPDLFLVKITNTGGFSWARTYGFTSSWDEALSVKECIDQSLIISGYTQGEGVAGFGSTNMYMLKTNFAGAKTWGRIYGGNSGEMGWNVIQTVDGGFACAGRTSSFGAGNEDVYLVKTEQNGVTPCNNNAVTETTGSLTVTLNAVTPTVSPVNMNFSAFSATPTRTSIGTGSVLCLTQAPLGLLQNPNPSTEEAFTGESKQTQRSVSMLKSSSTAQNDTQFNVYPNPVQPGASFVIASNIDLQGDITVTVSDMLGKAIYRNTYAGSQVAGNIEVGTLGWVKGLYMVTVQTGVTSYVIPIMIRE